MPLIIQKKGLMYFPVPKVACTSLKHAMYAIENGFDFQDYYINGKYFHIHNFNSRYETTVWSNENNIHKKDLFKFAVIRDPVQRLLSCYSNRVVFHKELEESKVGSHLPEYCPYNPDLNYFVKYLGEYRACSASINHHTEPMVSFLGTDVHYYDRIYMMSELDKLRDELCQKLKQDVVFPRLQTGGVKIDESTVPDELIDKIREYYCQDYRVFDHYLES